MYLVYSASLSNALLRYQLHEAGRSAALMESFEAFTSLLRPWLQAVLLPEHLWKRLYEKIRDDIFDSGDAFAIAEMESDEPDALHQRTLVAVREVSAHDDVWLVDHAWTFKYRDARTQLCRDASLRARIAAMLSVRLEAGALVAEHDIPSPETRAVQRDVQAVFDQLWRVVGSYRPSSGNRTLQEMDDTDHDSIWYVPDELGSAVARAPLMDDGDDNALVNVKLVAMPVCFPEKHSVLSVLWATKPIDLHDICVASGDFAVAQTQGDEASIRASRVLASHALFNEAFTLESCATASAEEEEEEDVLSSACREAAASFKANAAALADASAMYGAALQQKAAGPPRHNPRLDSPEALAQHCNGITFPIPFYTDSSLVVNYVTDTEHFRLVAAQEEARIMWMAHYAMRRSDEFPHACFVSQLPEERFFTNKRELARLVQRRLGNRPWFQQTYDATTELPAFIADFSAREKLKLGEQPPNGVDLQSLDGTNLWIAKPCNLARSIDMTVSNHLQWLLKVAETGPKIFCKYIANPCTLRGRKFDLRFVVAVRSLKTFETDLEAYLYNVFWTRFASEQYSLDGFDIYAKHWTVMNYASPDKLLQLHYNDFIPEFNARYEVQFPAAGANAWESVVMQKVKVMMRQVFDAVEPDDIPHQRFRGAYGVDVMIKEDVDPVSGAVVGLQPVLLEITFSPDCHRACKYHPHFFNDVFQTLFLGVPSSNMTDLTA